MGGTVVFSGHAMILVVPVVVNEPGQFQPHVRRRGNPAQREQCDPAHAQRTTGRGNRAAWDIHSHFVVVRGRRITRQAD